MRYESLYRAILFYCSSTNRLDVRKFSFARKVCLTWNNLPLMLSTLCSLNSFKRKLANVVLYANVCRLFVFVSVFLGTCVLESINFFFFLLNVFLVIVGTNEMYSQWLVRVLFVYVLCLLQVNNLLVFLGMY